MKIKKKEKLRFNNAVAIVRRVSGVERVKTLEHIEAEFVPF